MNNQKLFTVYISFFSLRDQRKRYHSIRNRAETDPSLMSVIIDGMDQSKCSLPHLKRLNKSSVNLWKLRTHITGVLVHGYGSTSYVDYLQWPHDPNLTINVLLRVLVEYLPKLADRGSLPRKLAVQLDNCVRENKNKFVLSFLALLVELGVFEEVSEVYVLITTPKN